MKSFLPICSLALVITRTLATKQFIIRQDDIQDWFDNDIQADLMNFWMDNNIPVTAVVISNYFWGTDPETLAVVTKCAQMSPDMCQLGNHSPNHDYFFDYVNETANAVYELQEVNNKIHTFFPDYAVEVFVPPYNYWNDYSLLAMQELQMPVISASSQSYSGMEYDLTTYPLQMPQQTQTGLYWANNNSWTPYPIDSIIYDCNNAAALGQVCIIMVHTFEFAMADGFTMDMLQDLINQLYANGFTATNYHTVMNSVRSNTVAAGDSTAGRCGVGYNGLVCPYFDGCCSSDGWCGTSDYYCGSGCQLGYGSCNMTGIVVPSASPTKTPKTTTKPTAKPTTKTTSAPSFYPTAGPSVAKTNTPTAHPTAGPTAAPSITKSSSPTAGPSVAPSAAKTNTPTAHPTAGPTAAPSITKSSSPTAGPTVAPSAAKTNTPTLSSTATPTATPSANPSASPTITSTTAPTSAPVATTTAPTALPTQGPTVAKTATPSANPSGSPTITSTTAPTVGSTSAPVATTTAPTVLPTQGPTVVKTATPSANPTGAPVVPTFVGTTAPTIGHTNSPVVVYSVNGRCGVGFSQTVCGGSQYPCCSQYGWCGATPAYCDVGCQSGYGKCNAIPTASPTVSPTAAPTYSNTLEYTVVLQVKGSSPNRFNYYRQSTLISTIEYFEIDQGLVSATYSGIVSSISNQEFTVAVILTFGLNNNASSTSVYLTTTNILATVLATTEFSDVYQTLGSDEISTISLVEFTRQQVSVESDASPSSSSSSSFEFSAQNIGIIVGCGFALLLILAAGGYYYYQRILKNQLWMERVKSFSSGSSDELLEQGDHQSLPKSDQSSIEFIKDNLVLRHGMKLENERIPDSSGISVDNGAREESVV